MKNRGIVSFWWIGGCRLVVREGRQPEFLNIEENWALFFFFLEPVDTSRLSNEHPQNLCRQHPANVYRISNLVGNAALHKFHTFRLLQYVAHPSSSNARSWRKNGEQRKYSN